MLSDNCFGVIMAGGAGTRLWPLSSKDKPKHFLKLFGGRSLIELTVDRLNGLIPADRILILTSVKYRDIAVRTLPHIPPENFVYEPCLRDTASAIGLAATLLRRRCSTATMIVQTADQLIEPIDRFRAAVRNSSEFLEQYPDRLVAFGVDAASPSTLVGWQKLGAPVEFANGEVRKIESFTEKPNREVAHQYMNDGSYCWNSGQFAWKADAILGELDSFLPEATPVLQKIGRAWKTLAGQGVLDEMYPLMPMGSIDYKVMQKTSKACSILLPCSWEDMGTHSALAERVGERQKGNSVFGKTVAIGTGNVILSGTDQTIVVSSNHLTVVVTDDTVFVGDRNTDMKALLNQVARRKPEIV